MASINILTAEIAHEVDLQRVASGLGALSTPHLSAISKFVRSELLKTEKITTIKQRNQLIKSISEFMNNELGLFTSDLTKGLSDVIKEEVKFQAGVVSKVAGVSVAKPTVTDALKAVTAKPLVLNGKAIEWDDYIKSYAPNQVEAVKQILVAGWSDGLTTREIQQQITGTAKIRGVMQQSQRSAYMMAKDLTSHQSSIVKSKVGTDNSDIIIGEKAVVTLDSNTSPICQKYGSQDKGGKEWLYKDGQNFPRSPYHRFCRTSMIFLLAPEYRELEANRTRPAVINGESVQVDASTNWIDIAKSNNEFAEISLGKTKAKLLDDMSTKEFTKAAYNRLGEPQTLEQMKESNEKVMKLLE